MISFLRAESFLEMGFSPQSGYSPVPKKISDSGGRLILILRLKHSSRKKNTPDRCDWYSLASAISTPHSPISASPLSTARGSNSNIASAIIQAIEEFLNSRANGPSHAFLIPCRLISLAFGIKGEGDINLISAPFEETSASHLTC